MRRHDEVVYTHVFVASPCRYKSTLTLQPTLSISNECAPQFGYGVHTSYGTRTTVQSCPKATIGLPTLVHDAELRIMDTAMPDALSDDDDKDIDKDIDNDDNGIANPPFLFTGTGSRWPRLVSYFSFSIKVLIYPWMQLRYGISNKLVLPSTSHHYSLGHYTHYRPGHHPNQPSAVVDHGRIEF